MRKQRGVIYILIVLPLHIIFNNQAVRIFERDLADPQGRTFFRGDNEDNRAIVNSTELRMPGSSAAPQPLAMARTAEPARLQLLPAASRRSGRAAAQAAARARALEDEQEQQARQLRLGGGVRWVLPAAAENDILRNCW